nr:MAG TPA_asm: hypothetical protein [Caudoviricetes sp.]
MEKGASLPGSGSARCWDDGIPGGVSPKGIAGIRSDI